MIRNFLFHRVNPQRDTLWDPMSVELFDKCICYISKKYDVMLFEELVHSDKLYSNNKIATIMFDDGYKDNIEFALPILEKYNVKASFYVVTDCIDNNTPTWTHTLDYLFQHTQKRKIELDFDFLPEKFRLADFENQEDRINYVQELKPFFKKIDHDQRSVVLKQISDCLNDTTLPQLMMNWDDLKHMRDLGHYIGSHTVTHCMLGTMRSEEEVYKELSDSGKRIEEELGYYPKTISYPVGSYNLKTKELAKKANYQYGLAVKQDTYNPYKQDFFEVNRIELYNESWLKTKMRISNRLETIKKLIRYR